MSKQDDNERNLDGIWNKFRAEVLERIERNPNGYFDASFAVAVLGGRVVLQQNGYDQDGIRVVEKFKN